MFLLFFTIWTWNLVENSKPEQQIDGQEGYVQSIFDNQNVHKRLRRFARVPYSKTENRTWTWPDNTVKYHFEANTINEGNKTMIRNTLNELERKLGTMVNNPRKTCFRFIEEKAKDGVTISGKRDGCFVSETGYGGYGQVMFMAQKNPLCHLPKTVEHEFLHVLGLGHSHQRWDRNKYLGFPKDTHPTKNPLDFTHYGIPYDYKSIMHYSYLDVMVNRKKIDIIFKDESKKKLVGKGKSLSDGDIEVLRRMYGCSTQEQEFIQWPRNYCPEGSYVYGYRVLTHTDTAPNSMELICRQPNHKKETRRILSRSGSQGTWSQDVFCNGLDDPVIGFSVKKHSNRVDVKLLCKGGYQVSALSGNEKGFSHPRQMCPKDFAMVGLRTTDSGVEPLCMSYMTGIRVKCGEMLEQKRIFSVGYERQDVTRTQTPEECRAVCQKRTDCSHWIWHNHRTAQYSFLCGIITNIPEGAKIYKPDDRNLVSGSCTAHRVKCGKKLEHKNIFCVGCKRHDVARTQTPEECRAVCQKRTDCAHWIWHNERAAQYSNKCLVLINVPEEKHIYKGRDLNTVSGSCSDLQFWPDETHTWAPTPDYCPEGSYVYGYRVLTHTDTALNSLELICRQPNHNKETRRISSRSGSQGTWSQDVFCNGLNDPVIGFSVKEQSNREVGELNLIKDVKLVCKREYELLALSRSNKGSWQPIQRCNNGFAVVGLRTREEGALGEDDGATLSGVELVCMPYV